MSEVNNSKHSGSTVTHTNTVRDSQGTVIRSTSTTIDKRTGKPVGK